MFLSFFISSCVFGYCEPKVKIGLILLFTVAFLIVKIGRALIFPNKSDFFRRCISYALCACTVAGVCSFVVLDLFYAKFDEYSGRYDYVKLRIEDCDYSLPYIARYTAKIIYSDLIPNGTKLLLTTEQVALEDGAILEGEILYSALSASSSSSFNAEVYYLPKHIKLTAEDESLEVTGYENIFSISGFFNKLNKKFTSVILAHTKHEYGGTAAAVLLGNREYLSDQTTRDFRRLGISHLLVVSGTHFSVVLMFAERSMIRLRVNRRIRAVASIFIILFFMALTGFSASVLRTGIMYLIAQIAVLADRKVNYLHSLAFAGSAIVFFNPYAVYDCSLQLSFTAAYSCLLYNSLRTLFYKHKKEKRKNTPKSPKPRGRHVLTRLLENAISVIGITTVVNITMLPLIWLYFGEISVMSIPSNLLFIPMITLLMYLTGLYLFLYPFGFFVYPLGVCINQYCAVMLGFTESMSEMKNIMIPVNYQFTVFFLIPLTIMIVMIPFVLQKHVKKLMCLIAATLCAFFAVIGVIHIVDCSNVYLSYVTKSKNDGFVLKSEGKILLCDISDASFGFLYELTNTAAEMHSCEIETLLLTHYHSKHTQYLARLLEQEILRSIALPEPIDEREESLYEALVKTATSNNIEVYTIEAGGTFSFGDTEIVMHPRQYISRSTHPITAVSVEAYDNIASILSCSFNQSYEEITDDAEKSDFLIFGHHSPVYKKTFGLSFENEPKAVIVSDAAYEYMTDEFVEYLGSVNMIREPASWGVKISQNGNYTIIE